MIVVLSPTKRLNEEVSDIECSEPIFLKETKGIMNHLKKMNEDEIIKAMKVKENLAKQTYDRFQSFKYDDQGNPALTSYQGIQYQYMKLDMNDEDWQYANKHIRILDALYGVLKPKTSIYPYRLDMLAKVKVDGLSLYDYWGDKVYNYLVDELVTHKEKKILCLASKEYASMISTTANEELVMVDFYVVKKGKYKMEATAAKMARGRMMGFILENKIDEVEDVKTFCEDGYIFDESMSDEKRIVFFKNISN